MGTGGKILHEAHKAATAIVMQKNVGKALSNHKPIQSVGSALGANAINYGLKHVPKKLLGGTTPKVSAKNVRQVANRAMDVYRGKKAPINMGDIKIAANSKAAGKIAGKLFKGNDLKTAKSALSVVGGKRKMDTKLASKIGYGLGRKIKKIL